MLRAVVRKGVADLRARRLQTTVLVVIIAMAAATATMALSVQRTASTPFEQLLDEANGPHLWVYDSEPEARDALRSHPGVEGVSGPFERASATFSDGSQSHPLIVWSVPSPLPEVGPALVLEGR